MLFDSYLTNANNTDIHSQQAINGITVIKRSNQNLPKISFMKKTEK